jgi:hypothetical protein
LIDMRFLAAWCVFAACSSDPGGVPLHAGPDAGPPSAVDLLFVIEDTDTTEEENLAFNMPALVNALKNAPSGAADLHIGVTTVSLGAGAFTSSIPGCMTPDDGNFVSTVRASTDPACETNKLNANQHFFIDGTGRNYSGDLATALGCIVEVGAGGCGFEHHLEAIRRALGDPQMGLQPAPNNAGFLRPEARLAVIILAEEDDCSAPPDSTLFDPNDTSLGPLASFRCTEYGITCDGLTANNGRIPRTAGGPYHNCRSNDALATIDPLHSLLPVQGYIDYLKRIKTDVVFATIAPNIDPFSVVIDQQTGDPSLQHSCSSSNGTFGDPAVRMHQVAAALGARALWTNVCQNSYADNLTQIANLILTP